MLFYLLKLALLLPLIALGIWGCLWLARKAQQRMGVVGSPRSIRVIETAMLAPGLKLAVIVFHDREILVSASRHGLTRLAEVPARVGEEQAP